MKQLKFFVIHCCVHFTVFSFSFQIARALKVAELLADLIEALVDSGMNLSDLSLVGHSLGAHVAGCAAKRLNSHRKIGSIIGLDPAAIGYDFDETENRLCDTDAEYVQVIHTDIAKFGMAKPMGHGTCVWHLNCSY